MLKKTDSILRLGLGVVVAVCWSAFVCGQASAEKLVYRDYKCTKNSAAQCACYKPSACGPTCDACLAGATCGDASHCGMPAPSYPVPFATPRNNTHTRLTYPPMMPHHSLPHYAGTYSFRHGCGLNRTTVHWRPTKALNAVHWLHHVFELPR